MSKATATQNPARQRPLSPHLSVYRLTPTMLMSGLHRITGIALYAGSLLVAWWL
ncbi:succinate:quinone oxidoreductase subunit C, partial [Salmonella enterica subsp. enterica]|nr:succinate:quinone oxidoreductase subunit C [Salmonella enterica subsp. enterica serovar Enteritidis]